MSNYRDRPLIEYLPEVIKDIREFQMLIKAEQPEIFGLFEEIQNVLDNQFVLTSTEYGVKRWEKMLKITPKSTLTLDERKSAIVMRLIERTPFTYRALEQILTDLLGAGNFEILLDVKNYVLKIRLNPFSNANSETVSALMRRICPANLVCIVSGDTVQSVNVKAPCATLQSRSITQKINISIQEVYNGGL